MAADAVMGLRSARVQPDPVRGPGDAERRERLAEVATREGPPYDAAMVLGRLLDAGRTLYALHVPGCRPAGVRSTMPAYVQQIQESYGYGAVQVRPAVPDARAIARMDQALSWVGLLPPDRVVMRRIVLMRMLCHPHRDSAIMSWPRVAQSVGASRRSVIYWHGQAVDMIVEALNRPGFCAAAGGLVGPGPDVVRGQMAAVRPVVRRRALERA